MAGNLLSSDLSVDLKGLKEVDERLVLLGAVAGAKVMRSVLFAAAKPILQQTLANIAAIPTGSGALAKATRRISLRPSSIASESGSRFTVSIAPKVKDRTAIALANLYYKKRKRPIRGIFWGHLVEWGFTNRAGRRTPGKHVFERAVNSRANEAVELFRRLIEPAIERALKKQAPL